MDYTFVFMDSMVGMDSSLQRFDNCVSITRQKALCGMEYSCIDDIRNSTGLFDRFSAI